MKKIIIALIICISFASQAQIKTVTIQASGLTCSMCSNSINKALKSIPYIDNVVANIKNSTFEINFKSTSDISFDLLKKKVEDAGFFVAKMEVNLLFENVKVANDEHVELNGTMYHFLNVPEKVLNGYRTVRILDKGFVSSKEYKKNQKYTSMDCYRTGVMGACCNKKLKISGTRIYHVTIS